jgi:sRNA-binding carbon storage regulator CsrA
VTSLVLSRKFHQRIRIGSDADNVWIWLLGYESRKDGVFNIVVEDDDGATVYPRKTHAAVDVGFDAAVSVLGFHNNRKNEFNVRIEAPVDVPILREEVVERNKMVQRACTPHTPTKEG